MLGILWLNAALLVVLGVGMFFVYAYMCQMIYENRRPREGVRRTQTPNESRKWGSLAEKTAALEQNAGSDFTPFRQNDPRDNHRAMLTPEEEYDLFAKQTVRGYD
jgi:hypothetical protein